MTRLVITGPEGQFLNVELNDAGCRCRCSASNDERGGTVSTSAIVVVVKCSVGLILPGAHVEHRSTGISRATVPRAILAVLTFDELSDIRGPRIVATAD